MAMRKPKVIIRLNATSQSVTFYDRSPPEVVHIPHLNPPDRKYIPEECLIRAGIRYAQ